MPPLHPYGGEADPTALALPLMLDAAGMEQAGEVLVGGCRSYVYEVAVDGGRQIIYADDPAGVLSVLIPGYQAATDVLDAAEAVGDRAGVQTQLNVLFELRANHAKGVRQTLQGEVNQVAALLGTWGQLPVEEQTQCVASAEEGQAPSGVSVEVPFIDPDGHRIMVQIAAWTNPEVGLVIDRGDYGLFHEDGAPEPESIFTHDIDGHAPNVTVLDSTDEGEYLASLDRAGWAAVTVSDPGLGWA